MNSMGASHDGARPGKGGSEAKEGSLHVGSKVICQEQVRGFNKADTRVPNKQRTTALGSGTSMVKTIHFDTNSGRQSSRAQRDELAKEEKNDIAEVQEDSGANQGSNDNVVE